MIHTGWRRWISALLTLALLFQILPWNVLAAERANDSKDGKTVQVDQTPSQLVDTEDGKASQVVVAEVLEQRDERIKHFRMKDGSFIAVDYGAPVHYAVGEDWADIDNTLVLRTPTTVHAGNMGAASAVGTTGSISSENAQIGQTTEARHIAANGNTATAFSANLASGFLFATQRGQTGIQFSLLDGLTNSIPVEDTVPMETEPVFVEMEPAQTTPEQTETTETVPQETVQEPLPSEEPTESTEETEAMEMTETTEGSTEPTVPETELATQPTEISSPTVPSTEETIPQIALAERYDRNASAQISYPDQESTAPADGDNTQATPSDEEEEEPTSLGKQIIPQKLRTNVRYEDVFPGVDLLYELDGYDVKEYIIVQEALPGYEFQFALNLTGLTPVTQEDGSIHFQNSTGATIYYIPAPFAYDNTGAYTRDAVSYDLTNTTSDWILTVSADPQWMEAEERVYPITIDPTLIDYTTINNFVGTVCNPQNAVVSTNENLGCGLHPEYGTMEIFWKFPNLPPIPDGHTLTKAQAGFHFVDFYSGQGAETSNSGNLVLYVSELKRSGNLGSLTWAESRSLIADGISYLDFIDSSFNNVYDGMAYWDITPAAKSWYGGGNNYGLVMTSNGHHTDYCRAWLDQSDRVALVVSYRSTNGIEDYYTYQTSGVGNAGTVYISDYTGQITIAKNLVSYASTINPFSLDLVYNSSYIITHGNENYDVGGQLGLDMHVGAGWQLSVMQKVEEITLQNDSNSSNTETYLRYFDGDGTIHYFAKPSSSSSYYLDEDGLGLKITKSSGTFIMTDDHGNKKAFNTSGFLSYIQDSNENKITINYTNNRISSITQTNKGGSAITVATMAYSSYGFLASVTDAAGTVYTLTHSGDGKLSEIKRGTTVLAKYTEDSPQVDFVYDAEAQYGIGITYGVDNRVSEYYEIITSAATVSSLSNRKGSTVAVSHLENGQTLYRDYGADRSQSDDDILTYYTFDYAGRSVNGYTTDTENQLLGASNAVFSGVGTTDKTNNRTLRTASIGMAAMNMLPDFSVESGSGWTTSGMPRTSGTARTGSYAFKSTITAGNNTTTNAYRTVSGLVAGETYTFSAYVNTSACTAFAGTGVYLKVTGTGFSAQSECVNFKTSSTADEGWLRLSVTFEAPASGSYNLYVYNQGAGGSCYVDDFQLEKGGAPSNVNLLLDGDFQRQDSAWVRWEDSTQNNTNYVVNKSGVGLTGTSSERSMWMSGDAYTIRKAIQTVPIQKAGDTYVLSGWAKAEAVPDNVLEATGTDAEARDEYKQFGLRAIVTYSDNTKEYHYVPFNPDVSGWQFVSMAIVPKKATTKVTSIQVICAYERNENEVYFDHISLTKEAAQTMKYDDDGNLVSVKAAGSSEETAVFSGGDMTKLVTGGSGTFHYTYDDEHHLTSATNGVVKQSMTYDSDTGNLLTTKITPKSSSSGIYTSNTYTADDNRLASVTQRGADTTTYAYASALNEMLGLASKVTDPLGVSVESGYDAAGRVTSSQITKNGATFGSVTYAYTKGLLSTLTRTAANTQTYRFTYDAFGNMTKLQVGSTTLANYAYYPKNGLLKTQTYGNGATVTFTYDDLGRTIQTTTSGGDTYSYTYTGDGQLYSLTDSDSGTTYRYTYDTLGRLIHTNQTGGAEDLYANYAYDDEARIQQISYSIPGVIDNRQETFYYHTSTSDNISDGALVQMAMFSDGWINYRYDTLSRLNSRDVAYMTENTTYLAGSGSCDTTTLPATFQVTAKNSSGNAVAAAGYSYTYDGVGNILRITDTKNGGSYINFQYDAQGQLTYATEYTSSGTATLRYDYEYDKAGNRTLARQRTGAGATLETNTYTYGDTNWTDKLTAYNGQSITYDGAGNPLSYYNGQRYTFTWRNGRELDSLTLGSTSYEYEYDVNGLRTRKVDQTGKRTEYFIVDGLTVGHRITNANGTVSYTMRYYFDEKNSPVGYGIQYGSSTYWQNFYFAKNAQGDVVALYRTDYNSSTQQNYGTLVCTYKYDPYGALIGTYDASGNPLNDYDANLNPFRYRSYYYDTESGFYYLQSRYYDPSIGRFINADVAASTGQGILGQNMFAYCLNNPVNYSDTGGSISEFAMTLFFGGVIGGVSGLISGILTTDYKNAGWREMLHSWGCSTLKGIVGGAISSVNIAHKVAVAVVDVYLIYQEIATKDANITKIKVECVATAISAFLEFPIPDVDCWAKFWLDLTIGEGTSLMVMAGGTVVANQMPQVIYESQLDDYVRPTFTDRSGSVGGGGSRINTRYNALM